VTWARPQPLDDREVARAGNGPWYNSPAVDTTDDAPRATPTDDREESRSFLQERLAFHGKVYALITFGFYVTGNLVALLIPMERWGTPTSNLTRLLVPATGVAYLIEWLVCRRGRLSSHLLLAIDSITLTLTGLALAFMVFTTFSVEMAGLSYGRALLLVTYALIIRAIIVPSSARRTFALGLVASLPLIVTSYFWYSGHPQATVPTSLQVIWTFLWALGAVVISTLASRVIFGLRKQVREAWQLGQYTLLEKVGEGGMGSVYRASHAMLRRPTAVKLLPPEKAGAERLERFEREVQLTSRLTHPSTVVVFDYGRTIDGIFYYAMEYLDGLNLEDLVHYDGAQPAARVVHILRQVAGSLAEAHGVGLIHRDIKPANVIIVSERGGVRDLAKVVDFGLAKDLDQRADLTGDDKIAGTPLYLSPEMIASPDDVDARSDLYSLACVGYFLVTAARVFGGKNVLEVAGHHLHTAPIPPSERLGAPVSQRLSALLLSCLEKDPARRPSSARAFLDALDACDDVAPWTDDQARAWWKTSGQEIATRVRAARKSDGGPLRPDFAAGAASLVRRAGGHNRPGASLDI